MKKIEVKVIRDEECIELKFDFVSPIILNISSSNNKDTYDFFVLLLQRILRDEEEFCFELKDGENDLYHEISAKYIDDLNKEIKNVFLEKNNL